MCNHTRRCRIQISASVPFALDRDCRSSVEPLFLQNFSKPLSKNLLQCVVKFNHETFLGCFLTFPVFSLLTTCSWPLAHLVGLSDALNHLVRRRFLNLRSIRSSLWFFHHILDGGSPLLISGLSSNFSVLEKKIAPVWHNKINGETYGQIEALSHIFSNSGLISLSETLLALLFRIPYSRASILSPIWEVLQ